MAEPSLRSRLADLVRDAILAGDDDFARRLLTATETALPPADEGKVVRLDTARPRRR